MKVIKQINKTTCGQACLAMILCTEIEDTIKLVGHDGVTSDEEMCKHLGLDPLQYFRDPEFGSNVRLQKHQNVADSTTKNVNEGFEHWTVYYFGKTLDPAGFSDKKRWPLLKFWNIR